MAIEFVGFLDLSLWLHVEKNLVLKALSVVLRMWLPTLTMDKALFWSELPKELSSL